MRSACSALLLLCACGTLSNEDIAFIEAIPQKDELHVQVPQGDTSQPACAIASADIWVSAKTTGNAINAGVDGILGLVDAIRAAPPTTRDTDSRTWGPFPDQNHPGVEVRVTMERELDANRVPWRWIYTIAARRPPADFLPLVEGEFFGAQAKDGSGRVTLHFENSWTLQINQPTDPHFPARIYYDLTSNPRTISLDLTSGQGFGLVGFDYGYAGYTDGHGRFDYAIPQSNGCLLEVTAWFTPQGAGKLTYRALCPLNLVYGDVTQCFDVSACVTYVNDPFAFTAQCNGVKPCILGNPASCPNLP
ncbi:MAG: hypothetical protein ABR567_08520 [Myxococcales bacterium]|nr:hypothetical protein [Myxococcales bacterium]